MDHSKQKQALDRDMVMYKNGVMKSILEGEVQVDMVMYKKVAMGSIMAGEIRVGGEIFERTMKKGFLKDCAKKWD